MRAVSPVLPENHKEASGARSDVVDSFPPNCVG